ncbi:MAG: hypothetical protein IPI25_06510 [Candidatus Brocadia sp.]|nr:MAG: hypothetical protein IPI25_06510 [Candidatus Brocadia sp.]
MLLHTIDFTVGATMNWRISDEELPTWLHTTLTLLIVSVFTCLLIVPGIRAIRDGVLMPIMGPKFGFFLFGDHPLHGKLARLAGWSLVFLGLSFFGIGLNFCRWARGNYAIRIGLWMLWIGSISLYIFVARYAAQ